MITKANTKEEALGLIQDENCDIFKNREYLCQMRQKFLLEVYIEEPGKVVQMVHTPKSLCGEIIGKLKEFEDLNGKIILTLNIEFLDFLVNCEAKEIYFYADNEAKKKYVQRWYSGTGIRILSGNFLHESFRKFLEEKNMKFDRVIINPPFAGALHLQMLHKALDICKDDGVVVCVHPSTWLFLGNKGENTKTIYKETKKRIDQYQKEFVFFNANKMFGIGMFMPCCITFVNKGKQNKSVKVTDKLQGKIFKYESIFDVNKFGDYSEYFSLLEKIKILAQKDNLENHQYSTERGEQPKFPFYINIAEIRGNVSQNNDKVMVSDDFYTFVPNDLVIEKITNKKVYFGFQDINNANNCLSYLKTTFARFCLSLVKCNSQLICGEVKLVPWLDFSQEWTDEKLKKEFNITEEEWKFIKSVIPDYY